jgi:hypothetical protein
MPREPRREKLTWWLLKSDRSRDEVLADGVEVSEHLVSALTTTRPSLFVKAVAPHPPSWMSYIAPHVRGGLANLWAASSSAVLIVEAALLVGAVPAFRDGLGACLRLMRFRVSCRSEELPAHLPERTVLAQ